MVGDTIIEATPVVVLPIKRLSVLILVVVVCMTAAMGSGNPAAEQYAP